MLANHALRRTVASRSRSNRYVPWSTSLSWVVGQLKKI
jgi:hypothetical protein